MRKVIAAINMTLDGYCDHTAAIADAELHDHFTELLHKAGVLLYGRITYQLMEDYWPGLVTNPSGIKDHDDFAMAIDAVPKIVFTRTLTRLSWDSASIATDDLFTTVDTLRKEEGKDIYIGSPSLIAALTAANMIDEYQLCIHPILAGEGLTLFKNNQEQLMFKLTGLKTFGSGVIVATYIRLPKEEEKI